MKIAIRVENKVRELNYWLWVTAKLISEDKRYEIVIGDHFDTKNGIELISPNVLINNGFGKSFVEDLKQANVKHIILQPEGAINPEDDYILHASIVVLSDLIDLVFAWGKNHKRLYLQKSSDSQNGNKVRVTGSPYFDIVRSQFKEVFVQENAYINKNYDEYVLVPTQFNLTNHRTKNAEELIPETTRYKNAEKRRRKEIPLEKKYFKKWKTLVLKLAEKLDKDIVLRPHPMEDHKIYRKFEEKYQNIHFEKKFSVVPWIMSSGLVYHSPRCTTGIEAAFCEKPRLTYLSDELDFYKFDAVVDVTKSVQSEDKFIKYIRENFDKNIPMSDEQKENMKYYIDNVDDFAADRIVSEIENLDVSKSVDSSNFNVRVSQKIKRNLKQFGMVSFLSKIERLIPWLNSRILKRYRHQRKKFPNLTKEEIAAKLTKFLDTVDPDRNYNLKIKKLPQLKTVYSIQRDS